MPDIAPVATGLVPFAFAGEVLRHTFTGEEPAGTDAWMGAPLVDEGVVRGRENAQTSASGEKPAPVARIRRRGAATNRNS